MCVPFSTIIDNYLRTNSSFKGVYQRRISIGISWGISRSSRTLSSVSSRADSRHADAELSASAGLLAAASLPASSKLSPNTNLPPTHCTPANRGPKLGRQFYSEKLLGHFAIESVCRTATAASGCNRKRRFEVRSFSARKSASGCGPHDFA